MDRGGELGHSDQLEYIGYSIVRAASTMYVYRPYPDALTEL